MLLGVGAKKKTYLDDVFSTYLYRGTGSSRSINTGVDMSKGGLTWIKRRDGSDSHALFDTSRGATKGISSDTSSTESTDTDSLTSFNNNGFSLGTGYTTFATNLNNTTYSSWSFRKAPGVFDIVTYTGTGNSPNADSHLDINHSLDSIPGMVIVKRTSGSSDWWVWHRDLATNNAKAIFLNKTDAAASHSSYWNGTAPTASQFTVGEYLNVSGSTYVAYLFAGGESTAATARSVDFDGVGDYLSFAASSDFQLGTGDFTVEGWFKYDGVGNTPCIFDFRSTTGSVTDGFAAFVKSSTGKLGLYTAGGWICDDGVAQFENQWYHFAAVKSSGTIKLYINGEQSGSSYTTSTNFTNNTFKIGSGATGANQMQGWISNVRVVKGTALYTSAFKPPTEPLTNITNTKLLCCNNSSVTGGTVLPNTPTTNGNPTASTDSPFDDPAGFVFGDSGDQNVIKCGSYTGDSSTHSNPTEVNVGFEPQWLLVKSLTSNVNWVIVDSMRQWTSDTADGVANVKWFEPNTSDAEATGSMLTLTSTGFIARQSSYTAGNNDFIYIAIRRPDGYVGKPANAGTDVFAMDTGNGETNIPNFDSGFPVDFQFHKATGTNDSILTTSRLTGTKYLWTDQNYAQASWQNFVFDSNVGWAKGGYDSSNQSWMWSRRGQSFDVVTYKGNGTAGHQIAHSLNAVPEMMWVKNRDTNGESWIVYHKGLDGGNQPETHNLYLNTDWSEADTTSSWNDTAPTSTHFTLGSGNAVNTNNTDNIAFLFASVDGISSVGSFNGSSSNVTITTGFSPRFILIKRTDNSGSWRFFDTVRGLNSDNAADAIMSLNTNDASSTGTDYIATSSTGFTVNTANSDINANGGKHIYYAHA